MCINVFISIVLIFMPVLKRLQKTICRKLKRSLKKVYGYFHICIYTYVSIVLIFIIIIAIYSITSKICMFINKSIHLYVYMRRRGCSWYGGWKSSLVSSFSDVRPWSIQVWYLYTLIWLVLVYMTDPYVIFRCIIHFHVYLYSHWRISM